MLEPEQLDLLWDAFKGLGQKGITMNHYELADECRMVSHDPQVWKEFLMEQSVSDYINSELNILQNTELSKLIKDASKSRSVGQAQLVNALLKLKDDKKIKSGPAFIYTYVPLSSEQEQCPNVQKLDHDPFLKEE